MFLPLIVCAFQFAMLLRISGILLFRNHPCVSEKIHFWKLLCEGLSSTFYKSGNKTSYGCWKSLSKPKEILSPGFILPSSKCEIVAVDHPIFSANWVWVKPAFFRSAIKRTLFVPFIFLYSLESSL